MIVKLLRELECAIAIMFPEVNAISEPVVIIAAGLDRLTASQNLLGDFTVTAVVTQDEDC